MLPDPLHPAVVHLPVALALLVPLFAVGAMLGVWQRRARPRVWLLVLALQALLVGSSWLALETGEAQEERVEHAVAEAPIESHEEAAERFFLLAGLGLVLIAAGMAPGAAGAVARLGGTVATFAVLAAGVAVGHTGGELVYRHGAADVYVQAAREVETGADSGRDPAWLARRVGNADSDSHERRTR